MAWNPNAVRVEIVEEFEHLQSTWAQRHMWEVLERRARHAAKEKLETPTPAKKQKVSLIQVVRGLVGFFRMGQ